MKINFVEINVLFLFKEILILLFTIRRTRTDAADVATYQNVRFFRPCDL